MSQLTQTGQVNLKNIIDVYKNSKRIHIKRRKNLKKHKLETLGKVNIRKHK